MIGLLKTEDDEYESFGKMLAAKLRKVSELDRKLSIQMQRKINDVLLDAELELLS
jgi:hypothetical protein